MCQGKSSNRRTHFPYTPLTWRCCGAFSLRNAPVVSRSDKSLLALANIVDAFISTDRWKWIVTCWLTRCAAPVELLILFTQPRTVVGVDARTIAFTQEAILAHARIELAKFRTRLGGGCLARALTPNRTTANQCLVYAAHGQCRWRRCGSCS